ncbi:hypothetical protein D5274_15295 [bacterium 1XD42-94]|jgi:hypothetical protein|nr:hypothetical protein [bacterium 1XD42-76]NBK06463.1 hypothetical protein [bacterium 1XD42-94]
MEQKKLYRLSIHYVVLLTLFIPLTVLWFALEVANIALHADCEPDLKRFFGAYLLFALLYFLILLVLGIFNVIRSFQACQKQDLPLCLNAMLIHKYGLVPFFFINFIVSGLLSAAPVLISLIASRGAILFAFPVVLPGFLFWFAIPAFFTWLALIPGAFWGIQVIRLSRRQGKFGTRAAMLHMLLQFLFLIDVLDAMYLAVQTWGQGKKSSFLIAVLYLLLAAGIIAFFLYLP